MQKIAILGMARSGLAAAAKAVSLGFDVFLSDRKPRSEITDAAALEAYYQCEFGGHTSRILDADTIIISPGITRKLPLLLKAADRNIEVISEIEFGFRIKSPTLKLIAVTGSNGKSTTVSLIHHLLATAGINSILAGNIGDAFTSFPIETDSIDTAVLEISSFQLETCYQFKPEIAALLNISPDHLNRYSSMEDYASTKFNIFMNQNDDDLAILNADDPWTHKLMRQINSRKLYFSLKKHKDIYLKHNEMIVFGSESFPINNFSLKGPHNLANIMAAILAVSPYQISPEIIRHGLETFKPLPHRLEFVAEINGISFFNDSKATNTDAVRYSVQSFTKPVRIIMGGAGKGEDYSILNPYLKKFARKVYLCGDTAVEMEAAFDPEIDKKVYCDLEDALQKAFLEAERGDIILLAPGCTSFDRFSDYTERGNYFKKLVRELNDEKK